MRGTDQIVAEVVGEALGAEDEVAAAGDDDEETSHRL